MFSKFFSLLGFAVLKDEKENTHENVSKTEINEVTRLIKCSSLLDM